jgi:hypothetical protein
MCGPDHDHDHVEVPGLERKLGYLLGDSPGPQVQVHVH